MGDHAKLMWRIREEEIEREKIGGEPMEQSDLQES